MNPKQRVEGSCERSRLKIPRPKPAGERDPAVEILRTVCVLSCVGNEREREVNERRAPTRGIEHIERLGTVSIYAVVRPR